MNSLSYYCFNSINPNSFLVLMNTNCNSIAFVATSYILSANLTRTRQFDSTANSHIQVSSNSTPIKFNEDLPFNLASIQTIGKRNSITWLLQGST